MIVDPSAMAEKSNPDQQCAYSPFRLPVATVAYDVSSVYAEAGLVNAELNPVVAVFAVGYLTDVAIRRPTLSHGP